MEGSSVASPATVVWHDGLASGVRPWSRLRCEIWTSTSRRLRFGGVGARSSRSSRFRLRRLLSGSLRAKDADLIGWPNGGMSLWRVGSIYCSPTALRCSRGGSDYASPWSAVSAEHWGARSMTWGSVSADRSIIASEFRPALSPNSRPNRSQETHSFGSRLSASPGPASQLFREPVGQLHRGGTTVSHRNRLPSFTGVGPSALSGAGSPHLTEVGRPVLFGTGSPTPGIVRLALSRAGCRFQTAGKVVQSPRRRVGGAHQVRVSVFFGKRTMCEGFLSGFRREMTVARQASAIRNTGQWTVTAGGQRPQ